MVSIPSLWLPVLLSGILVFVGSSVIHMFLSYHNNDFARLPDEDGAMDALRPFDIPPGDYVMPFAGIAFLWFTVALRMWISVSASRINSLYSNVQFVSGIIFIALLFTAGAASAATAASMQFSTGQVDPMMARQQAKALASSSNFFRAKAFAVHRSTVSRLFV